LKIDLGELRCTELRRIEHPTRKKKISKEALNKSISLMVRQALLSREMTLLLNQVRFLIPEIELIAHYRNNQE